MPNHIKNCVRIKGEKMLVARAIKSFIGVEGAFDFNQVIKMPATLHIEASSVVEDYAACFRGAMPKYFHVHYPDVKTVAEALATLDEKHTDGKWYNRAKTIRQAHAYNFNLATYGTPTWYEWSYDNWNTKWNAYEQWSDLECVQKSIEERHKKTKRTKPPTAYKKRLIRKRIQKEINQIYANDSEIEIEFDFNTAWACPHPVFNAFALKHLDVEIEVQYADEDIGSNCGWMRYVDGLIEDEDIAPRWANQSEDEHRKWRKFAVEVRYGEENADPLDYGYDKDWNYVEEEEVEEEA